MKYSTNNLTLSLYQHLATQLRSYGYDVRWWATGDVEFLTGGTSKGVMTLVPEFPANPTTIVRLTAGTPTESEIVIPAFTLQVVGGPIKIARYGLGDSRFERERLFLIDGFVRDQYEHRELADLLYEWLEPSGTYLTVWDYDANADAPPELDPALVWDLQVDRRELTDGDEAIRYYIALRGSVRYFE